MHAPIVEDAKTVMERGIQLQSRLEKERSIQWYAGKEMRLLKTSFLVFIC